MPFQTVAVTLCMALPTLFWTGEPLRQGGSDKNSNVYFEHEEHIDDWTPSHGPHRYKRETVTKSMSPTVPTVPQVMIKRGLEALTSLLKSAPESEGIQKRMLSPAMLQDWDIGETIRAMVCPQCLLEGFVFGGIFVSCDCMHF